MAFFLSLTTDFSPLSIVPVNRCLPLFYIVLLDNKAWSDSQDPMSLCQSIARKAFADFFAATEVQHAHWYQVKEATVGCRINEINNAFPSLSKLLSIPEELLMAVEEAAGLEVFDEVFFHRKSWHGRH